MKRSDLAALPLFLFVTLTCCACMSQQSVLEYTDSGFRVRPFIVHSENGYSLKYQYSAPPTFPSICRKVKNGALYFYAPQFTSAFPGSDNTRTLELNSDEEVKCIRESRVFWLNPDGSKIKIEVR